MRKDDHGTRQADPCPASLRSKVFRPDRIGELLLRDLASRWAKLPGEWTRFVVERENWGDDRLVRVDAERARLGAMYDGFVGEPNGIHAKKSILADPVSQASQTKAA